MNLCWLGVLTEFSLIVVGTGRWATSQDGGILSVLVVRQYVVPMLRLLGVFGRYNGEGGQVGLGDVYGAIAGGWQNGCWY